MKRKSTLALSLMLASVLMFSALTSTHVNAASFNPNRIIDDAVFDNANSMSVAQIDTFLNGFASSCISPNSGFRAIDPTGYNPTSGFQYGGFVTAGQVIYDSAQVYGINPQVLITTLEKEQSLVTGQNNFSGYCNNGSQHKYAAAVGYGCPDSGTTYSYSGVNLYQRNGVTVTDTGTTCVNSASKAGFSQQVIRAAWLLKFGEQRSEGNVGWAVIKGNWDNSDDPQSCYGGPMTQGTFARCPSGGSAYYDGYTTIDATSVHMDSGATAALYWYTPHFHGNQNFFDIYTSWFGNTTLAYAFKSSTSSTIYIYINGYKIAAPAMGVLQDFGFSPQSIQTFSQGFVDSIPAPPTDSGISASISYIVKSPSDTDADGGSVYLISVGKRYSLTSMQQFSDFGFNTQNIAYLPLSYIQSVPNGGSLTNYIKAPNGAVFQVSGGQKRNIFDYDTFTSVNPTGAYTPVSYYDANLVPSGNPLANNPILVKTQGSEAVTLYMNNTYYGIQKYETYRCWGFDGDLHVPVYRVADNSYIAAINAPTNLSCLITNSGGGTEMVARSLRYTVPSTYGISGSTTDQATINLANRLPLRSSPLKQYVQPAGDYSVWYLENGVRKPVPTYSNFVLLKITTSQLDVVDAALSDISASGLKLGTGQVVKTDNSPAVFTISGNTRISYVRSDDFIAFNNSWSGIETYAASNLDAMYPYQSVNVSPYFYSQPSNKVYFVDPNGCYSLDTSMLTSYGQSQSNIASNQQYDASIFPSFSLAKCTSGSYFVKQTGQALVYWIDGGQKHAINSWDKLVNKSGQTNPYVISMSAANVELFPTGTPL